MMISRSSSVSLVCLAAAVAILCGAGSPARAQQVFHSPDEAAAALASAVKSGSKTDMLKVFGPDGEDIISSSDEVSDASYREKFTAAYDAKHGISMEGDKKAVLMLGAKDYPFPVPLVHRKTGWEFDTEAGREEVLFRRIGHNELDAMQTCLAYVDAQNEYGDKDRGAGPGVYAQRIVSTPGHKDGLYWPSDGDESPFGELAAQASAEGYKVGGGPQPFHGYYYRILTKQGPHAPGGELDYVVNGRMIGGFALVAYPAEYGNSGVMTFIVNHAGIVYQKNLGIDTTELAKHITSFDPDKSWTRVSVESPVQ
ncbi:MAG TPA: DUF2950 domain-containing protein [Bradyrhizobium sp.]|nr:DUF2950 domain-containing protein [Bradyrhizobium sp.]